MQLLRHFPRPLLLRPQYPSLEISTPPISLPLLFLISLLLSFCDFPCFSGMETLTILGKLSKNTSKSKENPKRQKARKSKTAREGGSGPFSCRLNLEAILVAISLALCDFKSLRFEVAAIPICDFQGRKNSNNIHIVDFLVRISRGHS